MHCVDLGESFPTSIYLLNSVSIQPRTSPSKIGGKFNSISIRLLSGERGGGEAGSISFLLFRNLSSKYLASIGIDRAEMWASKEFEVNKK